MTCRGTTGWQQARGSLALVPYFFLTALSGVSLLPTGAGAKVKLAIVDPAKYEGVMTTWPANPLRRSYDDQDQYAHSGPLHGAYCLAISLEGEISKGDADAFVEFVDTELSSRMPEDLDPEVEELKSLKGSKCFGLSRSARDRSVPHNIIFLNSPGGSFSEGIRIAAAMQRYNFTTVVAAKHECLSACAIVFMNGSYRKNDWMPGLIHSRWMHVEAVVGFHAPFPHVGEDEMIGKAIRGEDMRGKFAREVYGMGAKEIVQFSDFIRGGADSSAVSKALDETRQDSGTCIDSVDEAIQWNVDLFGYSRLEPRSTAGRVASCANVWTWHVEKPPREYDELDIVTVPEDLKDSEVELLEPVNSKSGRDWITEGYRYFAKPGASGTVDVLIQIGGARFNDFVTCKTGATEAGSIQVKLDSGDAASGPTEPRLSQTKVPPWYAMPGGRGLKFDYAHSAEAKKFCRAGP